MFKVRANDGGEEPRANDVVTLRTKIERIHAVEEVCTAFFPQRCNLRSERRCGPGVHDVWVAREATWHSTLVCCVTSRYVSAWVHWQLRFVWKKWRVMHDVAVGV